MTITKIIFSIDNMVQIIFESLFSKLWSLITHGESKSNMLMAFIFMTICRPYRTISRQMIKLTKHNFS